MEIKFVYRRRVTGEQPSCYLIKISSFISGAHEDSKEGFRETKSQDQEDEAHEDSKEGFGETKSQDQEDGAQEDSKEGFGETKSQDQEDGAQEDSKEGFGETKSQDQEDGSHEDFKEGFGETKSQDNEDDGSSIERIPNECPNRRTYLHRKCKQKISVSSDRNAVCPNFHSRGRPSRVQKIESELRGMLYDDIFDRYFRRIWRHTPEEKRHQYTHLNCLWFCMYNNECFRDRVLTWIKKENIFSKTYVFIPIVMWSHWYLLIFCHLGESLKSKTRTPCMLLLDSLHALDPMRLEPLIRRLVMDIFKTEDRHENIDLIENIPLLVPKVPQQRNGEECGIFVLYYTHLFMESAPQEFSISKGYPYFMKDDWFNEEELEGFYEKLESLDIGSSDDEE